MANTPQTAAAEQGGMKKTLSLWNFFTIGFGAIIGTGWVLHRYRVGAGHDPLLLRGL